MGGCQVAAGRAGALGMMDTFYDMMRVLQVTWLHTLVKTHQTVHLKLVNFIVHQSYIGRTDPWKASESVSAPGHIHVLQAPGDYQWGSKVSVSLCQRIPLNLGEWKQNTVQNFHSFPGASPHPRVCSRPWRPTQHVAWDSRFLFLLEGSDHTLKRGFGSQLSCQHVLSKLHSPVGISEL